MEQAGRDINIQGPRVGNNQAAASGHPRRLRRVCMHIPAAPPQAATDTVTGG